MRPIVIALALLLAACAPRTDLSPAGQARLDAIRVCGPYTTALTILTDRLNAGRLSKAKTEVVLAADAELKPYCTANPPPQITPGAALAALDRLLIVYAQETGND